VLRKLSLLFLTAHLSSPSTDNRRFSFCMVPSRCPVAAIVIASENAHPIEFLLGNLIPVMLGPLLVKAHSE